MFLQKLFSANRLPSAKRVRDSKRMIEVLFRLIPEELQNDEIVFFCIGSEKITGDSFGPLVGSKLKERNYKNVLGTIEDPIDAKNLINRLPEIPVGKKVIAIDAGLGLSFEIGSFYICRHPIQPGIGVGHSLPAVGDYGILGVVSQLDYKEGLFSSPPAKVIQMAEQLVYSLTHRFPV